mmetsp:Transcript_33475/g.30461  ORF Transcript_33475/g.30461 Transcript_33475/m.30461 type:complete len:100 (-) Transcript_33475:53-352(-)
MVIAYLILYKGYSYEDAKTFVKNQRPEVDPGHLGKLKELYQNHVVGDSKKKGKKGAKGTNDKKEEKKVETEGSKEKQGTGANAPKMTEEETKIERAINA